MFLFNINYCTSSTQTVLHHSASSIYTIVKVRHKRVFNITGRWFRRLFFWRPLKVLARVFICTTKEQPSFVRPILFHSFHHCLLSVITVWFLDLILVSPHPERTWIFAVCTRKVRSSIAFFL